MRAHPRAAAAAGLSPAAATPAHGAHWLAMSPAWLRKKLAGRPALQSALANSGWLMLDRVLRMALAVLVGAWVARHLGPERYGELAYVLALIAMLQAVAALGLDGIVVRDLARRPADAAPILGTALRLRLAAGLGCWALGAASALLLRPGDTQALLLAVLGGGSLALQSADTVALWFQSQGRSRLTVASRALAYCGASILKVGLILGDAPLWSFALALSCETALAAAALRWSCRRQPAGGAWRWDGALARTLLQESWPFMLSAVSIMVYMRIDLLMLRELAGERAAGLYSAALPFSQAWHIVPTTVCASVLPRLSVLREQQPALYERRLGQLFSALAWTALGAVLLTAVLAPWVVRLLLGPAYADAVALLRWHAVTNLPVFLGMAQSVALVSERQGRLALARTLVGAAVSVGCNLLLIPAWGALGAVWSAIAAYTCSAVLCNAVLAPATFRLQLKALWPFHVRQP